MEKKMNEKYPPVAEEAPRRNVSEKNFKYCIIKFVVFYL